MGNKHGGYECSHSLHRAAQLGGEFGFEWDPELKEAPRGERKRALIVIDMQYDFIDGSLPVAGGADIVPVVNSLHDRVKWDMIVFTRDWHPAGHVSFQDTHKNDPEAKLFTPYVLPNGHTQVLWPIHCVQQSHGAQLHAGLTIGKSDIIVDKGINPQVDSYSGFLDNDRKSETELRETLVKAGITHVFVCGLAYDYCVGSSAIDAAAAGFTSFLIKDAARGVAPDSMAAMDTALEKAGVRLVHSADIEAISLLSREQIKQLQKSESLEQEIERAFARIDKNNSGGIDRAELHVELSRIAEGLGLIATPEQVGASFAELDLNHDQIIDLQEFKKFFHAMLNMAMENEEELAKKEAAAHADRTAKLIRKFSGGALAPVKPAAAAAANAPGAGTNPSGTAPKAGFLKFGGAPRCVVCNKFAYLNESTSYSGKTYHHACFKCKGCNKKINGVAGVAEFNQEVYHKNCFVRDFKESGGKYGGEAVVKGEGHGPPPRKSSDSLA